MDRGGFGLGLLCGGDEEELDDARERDVEVRGLNMGSVSARSTMVLNDPTKGSQDISVRIPAPAATIVRAMMA